MKYNIKNFYSKIKEMFNTCDKNFYCRAITYSIIAFLLLRGLTSIFMLLDNWFPGPEPPFSEVSQQIFNDLEQSNNFTRLFLAPWYRWDTVRYLEISDFGYGFNLINVVWPPLYPFLVKIFSLIFKPSILAAILVSNFFFVIGLFLTFLLTKEIFDENVAKKTIFVLTIFPTSFYFIAGYSESLYLILSVSVLLLLRKKKWIWAGFLAALATLTRVQGIILVVPIFIELLREFWKKRDFKNLSLHSIACLYAPFGYGLYGLYVHYGLQTDFPWTMLVNYWNQKFGLPWQGIIGTISSIVNDVEIFYTPSKLMNLTNLLLLFLSIYVLIRIRKQIPVSISIYCWIMMLFIIGKIDHDNVLVGSIRYLLAIFPIFWGLVFIINNKALKLVYFSGSIILQIMQLIFFYWWVWVA